MTSWFQQLRFNFQSIEVLQKAIVSQMLALQDNPKQRSLAEHRMINFASMIQQKSADVLTFLKEEKGMKKQELSIIQGQKSLRPSDKKKPSDITWQNFYDKVRQIKDQYKKQKQPTNNFSSVGVKNSVEYFRKIAFMAPFKQPQFSAEQNKGKYIDMHTIYLEYLNLCKVMSDGKQTTKLHDYLWFLQNVDKFDDFQINRKFKNQHKYVTYLESLDLYLSSFLKRSRPLFDVQAFQKNIEKTFYSKYSQGRIPGWQKNEDFYQDLNMQYCPPCKKLFITNEAYVSHLLGKKHKNAQKTFNEQENHEQAQKQAKQKYIEQQQQRKKQLAFKEYRITKLRQQLANVVYDTMNLIRKKQTRGYEEFDEVQEEQQSQEQAEAPIYNPKNLPLGWDGKPIPYWLYKLHGLGIQYKCQICGNYSYWGRRAFEMHFQEWRHNYGMRCLKIPNTVHFKDITTISDAIALHQKLTHESQDAQFRPDAQEQFQDTQGNVLNRKTYLDMKKQGLLD